MVIHVVTTVYAQQSQTMDFHTPVIVSMDFQDHSVK